MLRPRSMRWMLPVWVAGAMALLHGCGSTSQGTNETVVTVATFNLQWLGDGSNDVHIRSDRDCLTIADIIAKTDADIIAVQEVENTAALRKVLRYMPEYDGFVADGTGDQHVAVIYRKTITVEKVGVYMPLAIDPQRNRPGLLVKGRKGTFDWLMMAVHLKSTSRYDSTAALRDLSREQRAQQAAVLRRWADSTILDGTETDVLIAGDFNDYPQRKSAATLTELAEADNLVFLTSRLKSCRSAQDPGIDHIVASRSVAKRFIKDSDRSENFRSFLPEAEADQVSDHCPVIVKLRLAQ